MSPLKQYTAEQRDRLLYWINQLSIAMGNPAIEYDGAVDTPESAILRLATERLRDVPREPAAENSGGNGIPPFMGERLEPEDFGKRTVSGYFFGLGTCGDALRKLARLVDENQVFTQRVLLEHLNNVDDFAITTLHFSYYQRHEGELTPQKQTSPSAEAK